MVQLDLFDAQSRARRTDPVTSHEAAEFAEQSGIISGQQAVVLRLVREMPGATSAELATSGELNRYAIARRLPELERSGMMKQDEPRVCRISGRRAVTWFAR